MERKYKHFLWIIYLHLHLAEGCIFHSYDGLSTEAEGVRFIRVREDVPPGKEILLLHAYPRSSIVIRGMERSNDHKYFRVNEINSTTVQVVLDKSLEDLVDRDVPQNLLKFRVFCSSGMNGRNEETAFMSITVYVEDINDHFPVFVNEPYVAEVDELTPPGTIIFQGIQVFDRDKPNTPNSDVYVTLGEAELYSGGAYFTLESPHRPFLILKRPLDYDNGIRKFQIAIVASDRGTPPKQTNTSIVILIKDNDDLPPKFTEGVYRTKINEFYPMTDKAIHIPLYFTPPIMAFDQDSLNASLIYDIISGNERRLFRVNPTNGVIFLEKEIDLEEESLPGNTFVLQIEARQKDSPLKRALARVEIEVLDLNDNAPEFEVELYNISIVENLPSGFSVLQVNAIDRDQGENAEFFYNLAEEDPPGAFLIDARTGWLTVREQSLLDREARSSLSMIVRAIERIPPYDADRPKDSGQVQVEITLLDSNDNTPTFENGNLYEFKVNVNAQLNAIVGKVVAKDPDEGRNGMILYELQRPKGSGYIPFRLDSQTGIIHVAGPLRKGRIALFVEASDQPTNPSERRFSLAVITIEVHADISEDTIDFIGAPYEFWVGSDVPIGTSVGQVRTTLDYEGDEEITYDLLHSYPEGVPFAIEERSGIVTVIRQLEEFERNLYYFEAVANYQSPHKSKRHLVRRKSRSEKHVTKSGEVIEIDEGLITDSENALVTNVTIHVVSPDDERGVLMRGTNLNPIEFHIKENLPGAIIGRLLYKSGKKQLEKPSDMKNLVGLSSKDGNLRQNRYINSKFRRNNTNIFPVASFMDEKTRRTRSPVLNHRKERTKIRDFIDGETTITYVTPSILFQDPLSVLSSLSSSTVKSYINYTTTTRRPSTWRPKILRDSLTTTSKTLNKEIEDSLQQPSTVNAQTGLRNNFTEGFQKDVKFSRNPNTGNSENPGASALVGRTASREKPVGLRFLIANQQDVTNKITIMDDGTLMTLNGLDREVKDVYHLTIIAEYSKGFMSGAGIYQVNIFVDDENDNAPTFDMPIYSGIVYENSPKGTEVTLNRPIKITDNDIGKNAEFSIELSGDGKNLFMVEYVNNSINSYGNDSEDPNKKSIIDQYDPFHLYNAEGDRFDIEKSFTAMQLALFNPNLTSAMAIGPHYRLKFVGDAKILDHENQNFYSLNIIARDTGGLSSMTKLNIIIADVNDNPPIFEKIAVFRDTGVDIIEFIDDMEIYFIERMAQNYSLPGSPRLTTGNGANSRAQKSHRNSSVTGNNNYTLPVVGIIGNYSQQQHRQSQNFRKSRSRQMRKFKTSPLFGILEDTQVGTSVVRMIASDDDSDKNAQIFYEIKSENYKIILEPPLSVNSPTSTLSPFTVKSNSVPYFNIDRISGEIKVNHPLKANMIVTLNITVRDIGDLMDSVNIRFSIIDVNNHAPVFRKSWYSFDLKEGFYEDQSIDRIEAVDEDYGKNANISYEIESTDHATVPSQFPFYISKRSGVLKVRGDLDREMKALYEFNVIAYDNAEYPDKKLTSTVEVEVNVLDLNDNAPEFIGYDDIITTKRTSNSNTELANHTESVGRKLITEDTINRIRLARKVPVYKAYLDRTTIPGTFVRQINAIDKDYAGNGNGLVMFSLLHHHLPYLFEIDSRDGVITTISKFTRYNNYEHINLTIIASDLGSPSKSSHAILLVNLQGELGEYDEDENENYNRKPDEERLKEMFPHKYYEVEIEENNFYPMQLLKINTSLSFSKEPLRWSIVSTDDSGDLEDNTFDSEGSIYQDAFVIDPRNGTLIVTKSLDRETRDLYRLKVRADLMPERGGRTMMNAGKIATLTYPILDNRIQGLKMNEVRVMVHVNDANDNLPKFKGNGRPIIAVIPNTANFGFPVTQVEAEDADFGINAEIRYKLLNEPSRLFGIDEQTGKIRVLAPIRGDQRVYGFDVKATDRQGEDDGLSSITNVFVYILDENKQVRLVISGKPFEVEKEVDRLMQLLSEATGMDVRIRLLEPHMGGKEPSTDAYIYAVDTKINTLVNMEDLQAAMSSIDMKNLSLSPSAQILELADLGKYKLRSSFDRSSSSMSGTELLSIILAVIVFAGGLATSFCVVCVRYKRRQLAQTGLAYSIAPLPTSTLGTGRSKTTLTTTTSSPDTKRSFKNDFTNSIQHHTLYGHAGAAEGKRFASIKGNISAKGIISNGRPREYIDVPLPKSVISNTNLNLLDPDITGCLRFSQIHPNAINPPQDTSVQSHYSSGHDSGIGFVTHEQNERSTTEKFLQALRDKQGACRNRYPYQQRHVNATNNSKCTCKNTDTGCCEEESSDSYEDSLKNSDVNVPEHQKFYSFQTNNNHEFRRNVKTTKARQEMRHSFSGVRQELPPRISTRPRVNSFRNSMTDLEQRLQNLEQSFREPFLLNNNSRC